MPDGGSSLTGTWARMPADEQRGPLVRRRRLLTTAALSTAGLLLLAGCAGGGSSAGAGAATARPDYSGSLSILTAFAGDPNGSYFPAVIKDYERLHPKVHITLAQETDDDAVKNKEKVLVASHSLPDIFFSYAGNWGQNFSGGAAADLTSVIGPHTSWGATFDASSLKAFSYGGKNYGVPLYNDAKLMGYDKKLFAKAGVSVPTTFEGLLQDCATLKQHGITPIAFGNKDGWPGLHYLGQLIAYDVPQKTVQADLVPSTAKYDDPGYVTAMKQYQQVVQQCTGTGSSSNGVVYTTAQTQQERGAAAMYYQELVEFDTTNAKGTQLAKDGFGVFPLPAPSNAKGDTAVLEGAPEGYMVNAGSKQIPLAVDFLKFLTSVKNARTLSSPPYGQPSTVKGAVTASTSSAAVVAGAQAIDKASALLVWLDMGNVPSVADVWTSGSQGLVSGSITPEALLTQLRQAAQSARR